MIADINITEKSFGPKSLMTGVKFSVDDGEKIGIVGRNGIGKSTLFHILTGDDKDFTGGVIYRRGAVVVATNQEYSHVTPSTTTTQYILEGLPEYSQLSHIIDTYPATMGDDMKLIDQFTHALQRFDDKGYYQVQEKVQRELDAFQIGTTAEQKFSTLSGGQKRLSEVVKIMHSDADLALIDEPTNHMDYIAKAQFIDWMKSSQQAILVITHDRDVLATVDRIVELKDGGSVSYRGNYDAYLKQNAQRTSVGMNDFEMIEKRIKNLKQKVIDYQRLKEKSRNPGTIQKFKRLENESREQLAELQAIEKPTFWIDSESAQGLDYKAAGRYEKFKSKNIKLNVSDKESRSSHVLLKTRDLALGYDTMLFDGINIDLREGESLELRGRNGAGKSTLIKQILADYHEITPEATVYSGEIEVDRHIRVGVYEQEVSPKYFGLTLATAIEQIYLDMGLNITDTKIRNLMSDYLFTEGDGQVPVAKLSGGQKARVQIIAMLANDPQLLILDEPTNHLDLPSIEELETALAKYSGAVLYVSHDSYFTAKLDGEIIQIGNDK